MPPAPTIFVANTIGGIAHRGHANKFESFAHRFIDLRFLEDALPISSDVRRSGSLACSCEYSRPPCDPDWFIHYMSPHIDVRGVAGTLHRTLTAAIDPVLDGSTNPILSCEADILVGFAHPVPTLATQDDAHRPFGCFAAGTRIATEHGAVPIDQLGTGDLVHTARDGRLKPIVWVGHRTVDCQTHPHPSQVWPIRIRPSAFGPDLPQRDLLLSPDHAIFWIDALIPVRTLVNDRSIVQVPMAQVTYFHLELQHHDVVLADGMPAETFLDTGPAMAFCGRGNAIGLYPDAACRLWDAKACAPLVVTGPVLDRLRQWLTITGLQHVGGEMSDTLSSPSRAVQLA